MTTEQRPKLRGLSTSVDMPEPVDEPATVDDGEFAIPPGVVPASAWFATVWCAIVVVCLGVVALWVLAVATVTG